VIRLWDIAGGQMLHEFPVARDCNSVGTLAFSPDGQKLAAVDGASIHFFDVISGVTQRTLENATATPQIWPSAQICVPYMWLALSP
jgi:WD40 repeat protein